MGGEDSIKVLLDFRGKTVVFPLKKDKHRALCGFMFRQYFKNSGISFKKINDLLVDADNIILASKKNDYKRD